MQKRLFSSLAFRVLLVSIVFVIIPLIFYTVLVFTRNYQIRLKELFEELSFEKEELMGRIATHEIYNKNILDILSRALSNQSLTTDELSTLFRDYVKVEELSASFYLEIMPNGDLITKFSTLPAYEGVNFKPYFAGSKGHVFIAPDPVFKNSFYMTADVLDENGKKVGLLVSAIGLNTLLQKLLTVRTAIPVDIAIMDRERRIDISSTLPELVGQKIDFKEMQKNKYEFKIGGQKRYATLEHIPNTRSYLFLSLPVRVLYERLYKDILEFGIFLLFILVLGGIASFLLTKRMAKPLKELSIVMDKVGEGDLQERYQRDQMGFEINFLGERFNEMVVSLINYIEVAQKERAAKEAYAKELEIGHDIQNSILPAKEAVFPGVELDVLFKPAKEVAGDFFDWSIFGKKVLFVIADGVGKSVSGCLYAFDLRSILRSFATLEEDLSKVVIRTNALFCKDTKESGAFVTAFVASYEEETKKLSCINLGHNYPIIKRASGGIERIIIKGTAFGVEEFTGVEKVEISLQKDDLVIFFTDGMTDAQNSQGELFSEKRLEGVIASSKATHAKDLIQEISSAIATFVGSAEQYDDMTLLVLRVC